jgi:hypothetical protein
MRNNLLYLLLLSLSVIYYFLFFVLDIKITDLISGDKFTNLYNKLKIEYFNYNPIPQKEILQIQYPPLKPQYLADSNDYTRPELLNMSLMENNKESQLMAANENLDDLMGPADITDQKTNISEFVKLNQNLLYDTNRHNVHMGKDPEEWNLKGTQMFNKILNDSSNNIEAFETNNSILNFI